MKNFRRFTFVLAMLLMLSLLISQTACNLEESKQVEGYAWTDTNQNRLSESGEAPLANIEVRLYSASGELVSTARTSQIGHFFFKDVQDGSYYIQFGIPAGSQIVTYQGVFSVDPATGKSEVFTVSDTYRQITIGAGMIPRPGNASQADTGQKNEQTVQASVSITPSADATASQYQPTGNLGSQDTLSLQNDSRVYLRFPLDQLPEGYSIISAILDLTIRNSSNPADALAALTYPDSAAYWLEGALTWENMPAQAPGAPSLHAQLTGNTGQGSKDSFDVTTLFEAYVQAHPYPDQFELMISYYQGEYMAQQWYSREGAMPPQLNVTCSYHP